ncbi:long-chain-fatty-acid--CoA ligase 4-like isoform X2 [Diorhabda carinulata]|uniref:long-chain-fatty-acid--CoA ligase 4-like isoform X2 n=1 Tax=Diorhabda carinulata TaxID=1163345 RepID=UPI0025A01049|nr:long-chain-fatty-acid--CoA ligase 4-like isoform X2 [Diorhabda carinulata]
MIVDYKSNKNKYMFGIIYTFLYVAVFIYDVFTFPLYFLLQNPIKRFYLSTIERAKIIDKGDKYLTYKTTKKPYPTHYELDRENIDTMAKLLEYASKKHNNKPCLGTRVTLREEDEKQLDGRVFKKYDLGNYKWLSFTEVDSLASLFGKGLRELGVKSTKNVAILAETQAKWMIAVHGAFKQNIPLVTIYATLGIDGIAHAINETEVQVVITSFDLMAKFKNILPLTPKVKTIVYMEDQLRNLNKEDWTEYLAIGLQIISFNSVTELGTASDVETIQATPDDIAIIMYTSGSTGVPKGVQLTHRNMIASVKAFTDSTKMYPNEVIMGYLPLAHVFELLVESGCIFMGLKIGYSSALTMIDGSSKIKRGSKGDASILQPTFMTSVPLILDRIAKAIREKVRQGSMVQKVFFNFGYNYKIKWTKRGFSTPITDRIIFKATRNIIGGKLRLIAAGGAPLTPETHELIKTCLCVDLIQGYGLTETTACGTNQDNYDIRYGRVGPPMTTALVRLTNWDEGGYYVTDKPNPRGEILLGGDIVSKGYYKNFEKTNEDFFEENGVRWFRTGDIGEFDSDGSLRIIDRNKDLVKLQSGEYLSLGKIESQLTTCSIIDCVCIIAEPTKSFCVALVVANQERLLNLAASKFNLNKTFEELCDDQNITKDILVQIKKHAKHVMLEKFEIPERITLVKEVWTPDSGLVTATLKLKRKAIEQYYSEAIKKMYA